MTCPICNSESTPVAQLTTGVLYKCSKCFWLFSQNVPVKVFEKVDLDDDKRNEYLAITQKASAYVELTSGDKVLDINSGDGTLLGWYLKDIVTVGIEPNAKLMKEALNQKRVDVPIMSSFTVESCSELFKHTGHIGKFKIITIVDCFQDFVVLPLLTQCKNLLAEDGVIVVQAPYFPHMIGKPEGYVPSQNYILAFTLKNLFLKVGFDFQGVEFPKKEIRGYATHLGFKRFAVSDFDAKLKLYTQLSAAVINELRARFDLDETYKQLEMKLHPIERETRNAYQPAPK